MQFTPKTHSRRAGFTLIEMLVVSPLLVILVAVMIGFFVALTGDAIMSRERNAVVYSVQNALNQIEEDIRFSTGVVYDTGTLSAGQGSDSGFTGTASFTSSANTLVLELRATDKNPLDPTRKFLYFANTPNPCSGGVSAEYNDIVSYRVVYFLDGTDLTRRTLLNLGGRLVCGLNGSQSSNPNHSGIFQRNSCKTANLTTCFTRDTIVARGINSVTFEYFLSRTSTTALAPSDSSDFKSVQTTLTAQRQAAGSNISHTAKLRAARIN